MEKLLDFGSRRISAGKKRGTALILLRRARAAKKKESECTKKDIRTDAAGSSQPADLASSVKEGSKEGRKDEPKEEGREGRYEDFLSRTKVASLGLHFWGSPPLPSPFCRRQRQGSRFQTAPFTLQGPAAVICHSTVHLHSS